MPKIIGQTAAELDGTDREVDGVLDSIQSQLPILRESLRARRDAFGQEIERNRLLPFAPITTSEESTDKVRTEAARLGVSIAPTPKTIKLPSGPDAKLGRVDLTPEQRDMFARITGETAHRILDGIVRSPGWDALPDLIKTEIYKNTFESARKVARAQILSPEQRAAEAARIGADLARQMRGGQ